MRRTKIPYNMLVCDPSFTAWGWAVICQDKIIDAGCIKTSPEAKKRRIREGDDRVRRTSEIVHELLRIIRKYEIFYIASELPHGSQNAKAAVMIGIVAGVVQTISDTLDIPLEWFGENDAKKALLGRISASKGEIIEEIGKLYKIPFKGIKYYDEAIADAVAIYNVARQQSSFLKSIR